MDFKHLKKYVIIALILAITAANLFPGSCLTGITAQASSQGTASNGTGRASDLPKVPASAKGKAKPAASSKKITPAQADKMALALTHQTWVWEWVAFFVPYMSKKGVKKLLPASKNSEWAGSVDMATGKKLKFTKKKINAARKHKPAPALTRKDIDSHALHIMQSSGNWDYISCMLPHMTHKGIRAVVRCYNQKHGGKQKRASDYY